MTAKDYIIEKFGSKEAEEIVSGYCPSTFGFMDTTGDCGEERGCGNCWGVIVQELPKDFDKQCERFIKNRKQIEASLVEMEHDGYLTPVANPKKLDALVKDPGNIPEPHIKDSGDRTEFESGAVRDRRVGKGRCDLMPLDVVADLMPNPNSREILQNINEFLETGDVTFLRSCLFIFAEHFHLDTHMQKMCHMFLEVAKHFEEGCAKYGENNWRKGIPVYCYIDSAVRHYLKHLRGDNDERHDRAFCWNIMCCIWTVEHLTKEENTDANNG